MNCKYPLTDTDKQAIEENIAGMTIKQMANTLGLDYDVVYRYVRKKRLDFKREERIYLSPTNKR